MSEDKEIQKRPEYSIDSLKAKSYLASRGLRELGLLKDKKHFTIIYVCQFCGRLINFALTPCIFCGQYPKSKREVITVDALSSNSLEMEHLLALSKSVKNKEDLELIIPNLRELADDILEHESKYPIYQMMFTVVDELTDNVYYRFDEQSKELPRRSRITCQKCGQDIVMAALPCLICALEAEQQGKGIGSLTNELDEVQKCTVCLNCFLSFTEDYLAEAENKVNLEELVFVSVYIINRLVEKKELPEADLWNYWKGLLINTRYFGSKGGDLGIEINGDGVTYYHAPDVDKKREFVGMSLASNLDYLLKSK